MRDPPGSPARKGFERGEENTPPPDHRTPGNAGALEHSETDILKPFSETNPAPVAEDDKETDGYEKKFRFYIAMLEHPDPGRRWKAAESLARLGDNRAVGPLIQALSDEDWRVRQKTAWALGYLGDPAAIPALRRAYRYDLEGVREMITEAITMITMRMTE